MNITRNITSVVIAGAGPGDPELISVKALNYLRKADVVLIDRLVSPQLIEEYARKDAEVIYVGKQCSRGIHTPQTDINNLMVEYARKNKLVLRLKGGDASLFSNIVDELKTLKEHNIPYTIIPGISAAFGAAAYTGIPLTARGFSRGVRFLTLYDLKHITISQWQDWAKTEDTLVFYMSGQKLRDLTNYLLAQGIDLEKGIAVVEQATTPYQQTKVFTFKELNTMELPEFDFVPTLLIVGFVVNLHHNFKWIAEQSSGYSYFDQHLNQLQHVI